MREALDGFLTDLASDISQYGLTDSIKQSATAVLYQIFKVEVDKLIVMDSTEITDAKKEAERLSWTHKVHPMYEKDKYLLDAQLQHTKKQLLDLMEE